MWNYKRTIYLSKKLQQGVGRGYSKRRILKLSNSLGVLLVIILGIYAISHSRGGTQTKTAAPQVLGANINTLNAESVPEFTLYKAQAGDTLFNISQRLNLNVPWTTLAEINNLKAPFSLKVGQEIKLPTKK